MKTLELSKYEVEMLSKMWFHHYNTESNIYLVNNEIYKVFTRPRDLMYKEMTLDYLDQNRAIIGQNLRELILPKYKINLDGDFNGYGMKFYPGTSLSEYIDNPRIPFKDKKDVMIKIGELLKKMKEVRKNNPSLSEFYLNDLHAGNIIVTDKSFRVVDMDSISFPDYNLFPSMYLVDASISSLYNNPKFRKSEYRKRIIASEEGDLYCYMIMLIEFLTGRCLAGYDYSNFCFYLSGAEDAGMPKELLESFKSIYSHDKTIEPFDAFEKVKCFYKVKR